MDQITYGQYIEQTGETIDAVRMRVRRKLGKQPVNVDGVIPTNVLSMLTGGGAASGSIAPAQIDVRGKRPKAAKQATIPMPVNNSFFAAKQEPVKSQMSSIFLPVLRFSASDAAMATVCIVTAYGLISQYGLIGTGAAILYAIFALNTSRLTKKELSLESAKMAVNWLIGFELALVYVHSTMYYQKIVTNTGLMFNTGGWDTILTACLFGLGTSLLPIVLLLVSITETKEKSEHNYQNA
jgi:hypothetical protein